MDDRDLDQPASRSDDDTPTKGAATRSPQATAQLLQHYANYFPNALFTDAEAARAAAERLANVPIEASVSMDPEAALLSVSSNAGLLPSATDSSSALAPQPPPSPSQRLQHMYILQEIVGRSQGTAAFVAYRASDRAKVIAKIVLLNDDKQTSYARSEVQCLAMCAHFGIVKHYDDFEREDKVLLVMEYGSGGDLNKQVKQRLKENSPFREHEVGLLFYQIVLALDHVHNMRMMHRDLKTANIFLMPSGIVKLGDFGFSKRYDENVSQDIGSSFCGTPYYLAPELWERKRYSKKADIWSLGVILYELLTLQRPFKGPSQREIMQQVLTSTFDPFQGTASTELRNIVQTMLQRDPAKRPTTRDLLNLPLMKYVSTIFEEIVNSSHLIPPDEKREIFNTINEAKIRNSGAALALGPINPDARFEGFLWKLSSERRFKRRYFSLQDRMLRISITDTPLFDGQQTQAVSIDNITDVLPVPSAYSKTHPHQFVIWFTTGKKIIARANSSEERDSWIAILQRALGI